MIAVRSWLLGLLTGLALGVAVTAFWDNSLLRGATDRLITLRATCVETGEADYR